MSNATNDILFDRVSSLLPFLTKGQAEQIDTLVKENDLMALDFYVSRLERLIEVSDE